MPWPFPSQYLIVLFMFFAALRDILMPSVAVPGEDIYQAEGWEKQEPRTGDWGLGAKD